MSITQAQLKKLVAHDGTHNREHSQSVAMSLLALERRYHADIEQILVGGQQSIQGCLNNRTLQDVYVQCRASVFLALNLAQQKEEYASYQDLIKRMNEVLPTIFPEQMEQRVFYWEEMNDVLIDQESSVRGKKLFPLHYVFILVWTALNDHAAFAHNYPSQSLSDAENDLPNRLLTFFNALDQNIKLRACSHGARNALVLTLNKIHPDVDIIEDLEIALNTEFRRLFSTQLTRRLEALNENHIDIPLQKAILAWIQDDNGHLGELNTLLQLTSDVLNAYLLKLGVTAPPTLLDTICHYQPLVLDLPNHPTLSAALDAVGLLHNTYEVLSINATKKPYYDADLTRLMAIINHSDSRLLVDTLLQERLILASKLIQFMDLCLKNKRMLPVLGFCSAEQANEYLTQAYTFFAEIVHNPDGNLSIAAEFVTNKNNELVNALNHSRKELIENFFALWFSAEAGEDHHPLYRFLWAQESQELLRLDDGTLLLMMKQGQEDDVVYLSPYELNRIFLHALITPTEQWSELFTQMFSQSLDLIKKNEQDGAIHTTLKHISYPLEITDMLQNLLNIKHKGLGNLTGAFIWHPNSSLTVNSFKQVKDMNLSLPANLWPVFIFAAQRYLKNVIKTPEQLSFLLTSLSLDKMEQLLASSPELLPSVIKKGTEWEALLSSLNDDERKNICRKAMREHLADLVITAYDAMCILKTIDDREHKQLFYRSIREKLPSLLDNMLDYNFLNSLIDATQQDDFFEQAKPRLVTLIWQPEELLTILNIIKPAQRGGLLTALSSELPKFAANIKAWTDLVKDMSGDEKKICFQSMQNHFANMVTSIDDVAAIMRTIESKQDFLAFYRSIREKLPNLLHNFNDFNNLFKSLNVSVQEDFYKDIKSTLIKHIHNTEHLSCAVQSIYSKEHKYDLVQTMYSALPKLFEPHNAAWLLSFLEPAQITELSPYFKTWFSKAKSCIDYTAIAGSMSESQLEVFNIHMQPIWPLMVKSVPDFELMLAHSSAQRSLINALAVTVLEEMTENQLSRILKALEPGAIELLGSKMRTNHCRWPNNAKEFQSLSLYLNSEQRQALFKTIQSHLRVDTILDFIAVLGRIGAEQISALDNNLMQQLIVVINSAPSSNLNILTERLGSHQMNAVCQLIYRHIELPSVAVFITVYKRLSADQQHLFLAQAQDTLVPVLNTIGDFTAFLSALDPQQINTLGNLLLPLQHLVTTAQQFQELNYGLKDEQKAALNQLLPALLPRLVTSSVDVHLISDCLNNQQKEAFLSGLERHMMRRLHHNPALTATINNTKQQLQQQGVAITPPAALLPAANFWRFASVAKTTINYDYYNRKYTASGSVQNSVDFYQATKNMLDDYTRGDSLFSRIIHGNWNRQHIDFISGIVREMRSTLASGAAISMTDVEELLARVERESMPRNPNGSLSRRLTYLRDQFINLEQQLEQQNNFIKGY